eukprot:8185482-Heterocapsa_arctica.AAC.1
MAQSTSSSSTAGSHINFAISNKFADLEEAERAEEIVNKAEQALEERTRDSWDQASRNTDFANRKQQWHANKRRKVDGHPVGSGRFRKNNTEGSGPSGSEWEGAER